MGKLKWTGLTCPITPIKSNAKDFFYNGKFITVIIFSKC